MSKIKEFFLSKRMKTFYWHTCNSFVAIAIVYVAGIQWEYAPFAIAALNMLTKYLNTKEQE